MTFSWLTELRGLVYYGKARTEPLAIKPEQRGAKKAADGHLSALQTSA
jgi:hypothetical protein